MVFYHPFPGSLFSVFPLHFTSKHWRLSHNKWTLNHWTNVLVFRKFAGKKLLPFKRIVNNSNLNFNLHVIIILTFASDININLWVGPFNLKVNQINKKYLLSFHREETQVFKQLDASYTDTVLAYFTHFSSLTFQQINCFLVSIWYEVQIISSSEVKQIRYL